VLPYRTQEEYVSSSKHLPAKQTASTEECLETNVAGTSWQTQQTERIQNELTNTKPDTHTTAAYPVFLHSAFLLITVLILYHSCGLLKWG